MLNTLLNKDFLLPFANSIIIAQHVTVRTYCSFKKEDNLDGSLVCTDNNIPKISPEKTPVVTNVIKLLDLDDYDAQYFSMKHYLSVNNIDLSDLGDVPNYFEGFGDLYLYDLTDHSSGEKDYAVYLMDTYHSLVQLDVLYLSAHEIVYSFRNILRQIKEVLALLDRESVKNSIVLKSILDSSKVLNFKANSIEFYVDMLTIIRPLLIKNTVLLPELIILNQMLEHDIVLLYSRLKAVIGLERIRHDLLVSPELRLSAHSLIKRELIVDIIDNFEKVYPDYFAFKDRKAKIDCSDKSSVELRKTQEIATIRLNIQNKVVFDNVKQHVVIFGHIKFAFTYMLSESLIYKYDNEGILEEIRELTAKIEYLYPSEAKTIIAQSFLGLPKTGVYKANKLRSRALRVLFRDLCDKSITPTLDNPQNILVVVHPVKPWDPDDDDEGKSGSSSGGKRYMVVNDYDSFDHSS
jgi:hypothetical protein